MKRILASTALALAALSVALTPVTAEARDHYRGGYTQYERYGYNRDSYGEPVYRDTRVWRGRDANYYCRKHDGTTGLIVGAAAGALLGNTVAGYRDRTLGAVLGGAVGALLGKKVAQGTRCD